ncbi:MAG: hypothetical protein JW757_02275 [Anaerolineales bacterium]|nr:hypothetical protein [Anaerolineales bacterium]
MKQNSIRSIIAVFILALFASSCRGDAATPPNEAGNTANAAQPAASDAIAEDQPAPLTLADLTVKATLENRPAATATIGPEGGTLSTSDAKGTQYTLVIPEGALFYYVDISMTPLAEVEGEVMGDSFLAGVRLEPDGLQFFELVSLEITGAVIEEGAVGFTAQSDGQSLHLVPSASEQGSLTLTTSHFSDPGAAKKELGDNLGALEGLADGIADFENKLALARDSNEAIALFKFWADEYQRQSAGISNLERFQEWSVAVSSLLNRYDAAIGKFGWDKNTPGWQALRTQMSLLADDWHIVIDSLVPRVAQKCDQGEIIYQPLAANILSFSENQDRLVPPNDSFRSDKREAWEKTMWSCFHWAVDWQANVGTTATVETFENFINLGAEMEVNIKEMMRSQITPNKSYTTSTDFKVLYIQGFFEGLCEPTVGAATLRFDYEHRGPRIVINNNEIDPTGHEFNIRLSVKVDKYPSIDCGQGLLKPDDADAEMPFHGAALQQLNKDRFRESDGFWVFRLVYKPGGGVIAQFQEGYFEAGEGSKPKKVTWEGAEAELSQLVNLYVSPPGD